MNGGFAWGQEFTTVTGNETYTISRSTALSTPANIKSAAHYQVTNSGSNYLNHAIQTALNANYKKIYIEEGEYLVNAPINFSRSNSLLSGITIEGAGKGTIIKPLNSLVGHIFNLGVFQQSPRLTNTYCENNIIQNLFLDLDSKIKTGIKISGRGQYNIIENIWIQNAAVATTENYKTKFLESESYENGILVQKFKDINATVATGAGAIYVDLPVTTPFVPITPNNPLGRAHEADFNKFNNIFIRNCNIGISFNFFVDPSNPLINSVFNGNSFNNVNIDWFRTAVDFGPVAATCEKNRFSNFGIQPDKINNQFVFRRIHGSNNIISNINTFDWAAAAPSIFIYEISSSSKELTIESSNFRSTSNLINNTFYIKDDGVGTKILNNNDVNGYTNNILRGVKDFAVFGQNYYLPEQNDFQATNFNTIDFDDTRGYIGARFGSITGYSNRFWVRNKNIILGQMDLNSNQLSSRSSLELYGSLKWQPNSAFGTVDGPNKYVLANSDNSCGVQWTKVSDLLSASSWNHIASQNIKMNNFAIVNNPVVPDPENAPGMRLDNNGNVRVGTQAPVTINTPKMQIDGEVYAEMLTSTNGSVPNNSVAANFLTNEEQFKKSLALNVGALLDNQDGFPAAARTLKLLDFPKSNFREKPVFHFTLEDRNNSNRFRFVAETGGYSSFVLSDYQQKPYLVIGEGPTPGGAIFSHASLLKPITSLTIGASWGTIPSNQQSNYKLVLKYGESGEYVRPGSLYADNDVVAMGAIGIGTEVFSYSTDVTTSNDGIYKLAVNGKIRGTGLRLTTQYWSDFVFAKDYKLPSLQEVEHHIVEKGHLPNIPSEKEMVEKGLDVVEMAKLQMQKIEELTLYIIEQNKKIEVLESKVNALQTKK
jgi:hypothetical protein